jgi:hypothetical protein
MNKLPRPRKRVFFFLAKVELSNLPGVFQFLAAPDISSLCVGGFSTAPVTHQD